MRSIAAVATISVIILSACSTGGDEPTPTESDAELQAALADSSGADNPLLAEAVADYSAYVAEQVDLIVTDAKVFTDAARAQDLDASETTYAPSREGWERIEPIAGLIEAIDGAVDARVDDFASEDDPDFTGWHRLEYIVFDQGTTDGAASFADKLEADLQILQEEIGAVEITPAAMAVGGAELIEEVSLGKITGEENRYAKTDLWDIAANLEGAEQVTAFLTPALEEADPELLAAIEQSYAEVWDTLNPLRDGDGWVLYCLENDEFPSDRCPAVTVPQDTVDVLQAQLAALSEDVSQTAGALGVQ